MTKNAASQAEGGGAPAANLVQFYVPATSSLQERRPRTLKHGDTFGVFDHYGDIVSGDRSPEGLFHRDTRYLSEFSILINDRRPLLLSSAVQDNNVLLTADLTNPDFFDGHNIVLTKDIIHITRSKYLWSGKCYERLSIRNFDDRPHRVRLEFSFAADFYDIFEVRGHRRPSRGDYDIRVGDAHAEFSYRGLDKITRRALIAFSPDPVRIDERRAVFDIKLETRGRVSLFCSVDCEEGEVRLEAPHRRFFTCLRQARRAHRHSVSRAASIETSNPLFNDMLRRSIADLYMLTTSTEHGPYPYAGIPWFSTAFGRDAIITAIEILWIDPALARGVLRYLAATQASETKPAADAEPGKILHETRYGELARLGEVPFERYYGSVDSTPLFVLLAGLYFERTGDLETVSELWPSIEAALGWIDENCNQQKHGFLTYHRARETGLANQGWKDSGDSVFHADGSDATGAIALCEAQGYVYAAKHKAAAIASAIGFEARARALERQAEEFRARFETAFWSEKIGMYAMALDGSGDPCLVRSSNAGQLLMSGMIPENKARRMADRLLTREFFSGWGIRTIADTECRYNPMSYHNGSVWPHDNALIGLGLARYGLKSHLLRLFTGLFDAGNYIDLRRLPELFCGFRRSAGNGPTFYPVACSPQAWSSATPFALLQACFGLHVDFAREVARFHQPRLPPFINDVVIRSLEVGESRLDILLRRYGADVSVNVLNREGDAQVAVTL